MWDLSTRSALSKTTPIWKEDPRSSLSEVILKFLRPDWWITLTFRKPETTTMIAMGSLRSWLSQWGAELRSGTVRRPGSSPLCRLVWCVELQSRGTAHIHAIGEQGALPNGPHCPRCFSRTGWNAGSPIWREMKESWYTHHGIARFHPYDDSRGGGCAAYVAKYMFKADTEWGLWETGKEF